MQENFKPITENYDHNYIICWTQFKPDDQYFETVTQFWIEKVVRSFLLILIEIPIYLV